MGTDNIMDLDVLRPKDDFIQLNGKRIDVSFVPCAITFDLDEKVNALSKFDTAELNEGKASTKAAFQVQIELCSVFCSHKYPEMTPEWFSENTDAGQVLALAMKIRDALDRSYHGVETYGKN